LSLLASASIGQSLTSFFDSVGQFFSDLAQLNWGVLLIGLVFFTANLTLRSRAFYNSLRAAYPAERFPWLKIWGAYWAAVGFNNVVPARGGDIIKLFLTKISIPNSRYATVAAAFYVESVFDAIVGVFVLIYAFTQGVFPKPPDFAKLNAFDISWLAGHFHFTLFLLTTLAIVVLSAFAYLSPKVQAFWLNVRQGFTILRDRPRWLREVVFYQSLAWACRFAAYWFLLDAFRLGGSFHKVLLVFGVQAVAGAVPLTPGGAGVQQALLVQVFSSFAGGSIVAAYSVGQQIAIAALTATVGLSAVIFIFRFHSFREVITAGRASREAERAEEAERAKRAGPSDPPAAPRSPRPPPRSRRAEY
jgi:uncharacterized membrane protein YbhN (UPF0104 family)